MSWIYLFTLLPYCIRIHVLLLYLSISWVPWPNSMVYNVYDKALYLNATLDIEHIKDKHRNRSLFH